MMRKTNSIPRFDISGKFESLGSVLTMSDGHVHLLSSLLESFGSTVESEPEPGRDAIETSFVNVDELMEKSLPEPHEPATSRFPTVSDSRVISS